MLINFRAYRGNIANASTRFDDDLYKVWLERPENTGKNFDDFTAWLQGFRPDDDQAPDFVARMILKMKG